MAQMRSCNLGLDDWFVEQARTHCGTGLGVARVTAVDRARYLVRDEHGELPAELTGRLRFVAESSIELPCVGDWVCVRCLEDRSHASIDGVLPRRTFLRRKTPGKNVDFQMIAANIDVAFGIQACGFDFNVRRLERCLVMVREGHIEPVLLLTKIDLISPDDLDSLIGAIRRAGIDATVVPLSNVTGAGLDQIRGLLTPGRTYCLLGSSGVGKTTLVNHLAGGSGLETRDVSHTGEGRHTTTRRQLVVLDGDALLIDMPGMRELGMLGVSEGLEDAFADIGELAKRCRFKDCAHSSEPGCAVRAAIEQQDLSEQRLQDYLKLRKEAAFHDLSYVDRRKKDRDFGRIVRSVLKNKGKRGEY